MTKGILSLCKYTVATIGIWDLVNSTQLLMGSYQDQVLFKCEKPFPHFWERVEINAKNDLHISAVFKGSRAEIEMWTEFRIPVIIPF